MVKSLTPDSCWGEDIKHIHMYEINGIRQKGESDCANNWKDSLINSLYVIIYSPVFRCHRKLDIFALITSSQAIDPAHILMCVYSFSAIWGVFFSELKLSEV